eukprot:6207430-Amphidinium_carterae.1
MHVECTNFLKLLTRSPNSTNKWPHQLRMLLLLATAVPDGVTRLLALACGGGARRTATCRQKNEA